MAPPEVKRPIHWRRVLQRSAMIVSLPLLVFGVVFLERMARETRAERLIEQWAAYEKDRVGLYPCDLRFPDEETDAAIDRAAGATGKVAITVYPAFEPEYGLRLVEGAIVRVGLKRRVPPQDVEPHLPPTVVPRTPGTVSTAPLSPAADEAITTLLSYEITQAGTSRRSGLDGTIYRFRLPDGPCAETWSPDPGTRAWALVDLIDQLEQHASLSAPNEIARSNQDLRRSAKRLQTRLPIPKD